MANTLIINGSPKIKNSASSVLIDMLCSQINETTDIISIHFNNFKTNFGTLWNKYKKVVICAPLYADGLPSHLLEALTINEKSIHPSTHIYAIINCGLVEGIHAKQALDIIRNFALRCHCIYAGGIGIGGCGGLYEMKEKNILKLFSRKINRKMNEFAQIVHSDKQTPNIYTKIGFTRILYKIIANFDWRKRIQKAKQ